MKLLIASNNKHKIEEIKTILQDKFNEIVSLSEMGIQCEPEETGTTFEENALIKAQAVAKYTNLPILADDTGLCVDALGGKPGVHTARYAGNHDSAANRRKLLAELSGKTDRSAHFECAVVLLYPDGKLLRASGRVDGYITQEETGDKGFGYDCIFFCTQLKKCFGKATAQEKNAVSHRGNALHNLLKQL